MKKLLLCLLLLATTVSASVPIPLGFWQPASAAVPTIVPTDIPNLDHWYKADSFVGLTNGAKVGAVGKEWVDPIGGSVYYGRTIATPVFDPSYFTNVQNGLPGIYFTNLIGLAQQNLLDCSSGSSANKIVYAGDYTILCVIKPVSVGYQGGVIVGDAFLRGGVIDQSGTVMGADNGTAYAGLTGLSSDLDTTLSVAFHCASGTTTFYRNNVSVGSVTLTGIRTSHISASADINGNSSASTRFNGWIFEILYYGRALTSTERAQLQTYFGRWGI